MSNHHMIVHSPNELLSNPIRTITVEQYRNWFATGKLFSAADTEVNEKSIKDITLDLALCGPVAYRVVHSANIIASQICITVKPFDVIDALAGHLQQPFTMEDLSDVATKVSSRVLSLYPTGLLKLIDDPSGYQYSMTEPFGKEKKVFTLWRMFEILLNLPVSDVEILEEVLTERAKFDPPYIGGDPEGFFLTVKPKVQLYGVANHLEYYLGKNRNNPPLPEGGMERINGWLHKTHMEIEAGLNVGKGAIEIPIGEPATWLQGNDALGRIKSFSSNSINLKDFLRTIHSVLAALRELVVQRCGERYNDYAVKTITHTIILNRLPVDEFLNALENVCTDSSQVQLLCKKIDQLGLESDNTNMWKIKGKKHRSKTLIELVSYMSNASMVKLHGVDEGTVVGGTIDDFKPSTEWLKTATTFEECDVEEITKMAVLIKQIYGRHIPESWTDETVRGIAKMRVLNDVRTSSLVSAFLQIDGESKNGLEVVEAILGAYQPFEIEAVTSGDRIGSYYVERCDARYTTLKEVLLGILSRTAVKSE